jgi:hypothetical protein
MKQKFKLKISNRAQSQKAAIWFLQENATNFHSVNVSAVTFKDNNNITLTSMFV